MNSVVLIRVMFIGLISISSCLASDGNRSLPQSDEISICNDIEKRSDSSSEDGTPDDPNKCEMNQPMQCDATYPYRTFNGTCNNINHPTWGSASECYLRFQPAVYEGYGNVRRSTNGGSLPKPRELTLQIFTNLHQPTPEVSFMFTIYGQTAAHDSSLALQEDPIGLCCVPENANDPACMPIHVGSHDPFYSQFNQTCLEFNRTEPCTKCNTANREQANGATAALDASIVYGSDDDTANQLRTNDGTGRLISNYTEKGELLPTGKAEFDIFCPRTIQSKCFFAGDVRVNQHATLSSLQTLFVREHNRLAGTLKILNPQWGEERLFQEARKINIATLQCITYKEYLPYLLGPVVMDQYDLRVKPGSDGSQYDSHERLGVWNEFGAAAFRLHSMVATDVGALHLQFKQLYSNPDLLRQGHMSQIMQGVCKVPSEKYDHWYVKDVTDYLYQFPGTKFGNDLSSTDMQRGRDHGLAPYVYLVQFCSGINISSFEDLSPMLMSKRNAKLLRKNFATVQDVDLWVGMQMENHLPGSEVGPTAACIIAKQFHSLKFGDRFYFEHDGEVPSFTPAQRENLKDCSLSRLLCDNTNITNLQKNVMLLPSCQNPEVQCDEIPKIDFGPWKETEAILNKIL